METSRAVRALSALAQESRLAVFRLLVEHGPAGLTPGAIAEKLDIPAPTLSFHLKELAGAGLVSSCQAGRFLLYTTEFGTMRELVEFLYHNCCRAGVERRDPAAIPARQVKVAAPKAKPARSRK